LRNASHFIGACFSLAVKNIHLKRSWLIAGLGGLLLLVIGFIPLMLAVGLIGLSPIGLIAIGLFSTLLAFLLLAWGQITALVTSKAFAEAIQNIDGSESASESSFDVIVNHGFDAFLLAVMLPGIFILKKFRQLFKRESGAQFDWLNARYLVIPVISLEDLKLAKALERIKQIIAENLLRFRENLVPITSIAHILQWFLMLSGIVLGFVIGIKIADPLTANPWQRVLGAGLGLLTTGILSNLGIVFSNFIKACYATALYQWVRNVELARETGESGKAAPPEILRKILGMQTSQNKE
jgi:hypothetical protein